jgi:GGDEF domain-containing protein
MMVTLVNLNKFQEKYGFVAADDVLRAVNLMIHTAVREVGRFSDFIGHLTSDTILIVTTPDTINQLRERVTIRLQQTLDYFYPLNDRERPLSAQDRLRVEIKQIDSSAGKFSSVEDLKIALAESKLI